MTEVDHSAPALEVQALEVAYGAVRALKGVSLKVRAGAVTALVGPNGAGKSTLLRTISGLRKPQRGEIRAFGASIGGKAPHQIARSGILHTPESREIFGGMTTLENLLVAFDNLNTGDREQELDEVFELFPVLRERRSDYAGNLSGGQQQMLAIARSLLGRPRLLMLDEPSLGLASIIINDIYAALGRLRESGISILLVEQNARRAMRFADYGYVFVNGAVALEGDRDRMLGSKDLISRYLGEK
ncbi:MAG: hypothetical protein BGP06_17400 [Rhizobiales bacterium 65-9]|nr:ABC transporter ATP-binding protein [Hyphomicrobiales bacterium]OJY40216.1 MAG: hypothetical protein BGP06_17400 [Rhizobiales bacterium 65-9]